VAKTWSPLRNNAPNIEKEDEESNKSRGSDLRGSWKDDLRAVGVMTLGIVRAVTLEIVRVLMLEVDKVLTPKLIGELTLIN